MAARGQVTLCDPLLAQGRWWDVPHPVEGGIKAGAGGIEQRPPGVVDGGPGAVVSRAPVARQRGEARRFALFLAKKAAGLQLPESVIAGLLDTALGIGDGNGQLQAIVIHRLCAAAVSAGYHGKMATVTVMLQGSGRMAFGGAYLLGPIEQLFAGIAGKSLFQRPQWGRRGAIRGVRQKQAHGVVMLLGQGGGQIEGAFCGHGRHLVISAECLLVQFGGFPVCSQRLETGLARWQRGIAVGQAVVLQAQPGQRACGLRPQRVVGGVANQVFVADPLRVQGRLGEHQGIAALAVRQLQAPALGIVQMDKLCADFADVVRLLGRVVGVAPPCLLMGLAERGRVAGLLAPCVVDGQAVDQAAITIPSQVDGVLAGRIGGLAFVTVHLQLQRQYQHAGRRL